MSSQVLEPAGKEDHRYNPVDVHVGGRVRQRRTLLGMSQEKLAEGLGLTFQQVQKYERGVNRIGASRLFDLSRLLDVPVGFFYDDMPQGPAGAPSGTGAPPPGSGAGYPAGGDEAFSRRETLEMVRAYYRIGDPDIRRRVFDLVKSLGPVE